MINRVFIVISVIYFKEKPLSYSTYRSSFSPLERLTQTKKTIESIRMRVPDAKIFLFEQGIKDVYEQLGPLVDLYYYAGGNKVVRFFTDGVFKGLGEAVGLLFSTRYFPRKSRIFKISGRYYLDDSFNLNDWDSGRFIFLKKNNCLSTRLYSFESSVKNIWILSLILSLPLLFLNMSIEKTMAIFIPRKMIRVIDKLGLRGFVGVGEQSNELSE